MKKSVKGTILVFSLIAILSISFASAGWLDVLKQIFGIGGGEDLGGELGTISPAAADYTCTETDGGRDYNNYGETKGIMYGTSSDYQIKYDACSTARYGNKVLVEFYCESNRVRSESHICAYICENGKCVSCTPSCTNASCGDDWCGGSCGTCSSGYICEYGACVSVSSKNDSCFELDIYPGDPVNFALDGTEHIIELITTTSPTTAKIAVDGTTKTVTRGGKYLFPGNVIVYVEEVIYPAYAGDYSSVQLTICSGSAGGSNIWTSILQAPVNFVRFIGSLLGLN